MHMHTYIHTRERAREREQEITSLMERMKEKEKYLLKEFNNISKMKQCGQHDFIPGCKDGLVYTTQ